MIMIYFNTYANYDELQNIQLRTIYIAIGIVNSIYYVIFKILKIFFFKFFSEYQTITVNENKMKKVYKSPTLLK